MDEAASEHIPALAGMFRRSHINEPSAITLSNQSTPKCTLQASLLSKEADKARLTRPGFQYTKALTLGPDGEASFGGVSPEMPKALGAKGRHAPIVTMVVLSLSTPPGLRYCQHFDQHKYLKPQGLKAHLPHGNANIWYETRLSTYKSSISMRIVMWTNRA
ncbi:hypothetical protein PQX77_013050 [Marasmius sp. AFHP31]|nr:hypothetical protein PQX77_013050 [Marasmius sp. AFHP31]